MNFDSCEHELVHLSTDLDLEAEFNDDDNDDQAFEWPVPPSFSNSSAIEELNESQQIPLSTSSFNRANNEQNLHKPKRRQWTIKEKLNAIALYERIKSKRKTARNEGCTTAQLRHWINDKENLLKMNQNKRGSFLLYLNFK